MDNAFIVIDGKRYIWKKEWVRPYESAYSVLRNFCKVNLLTGTAALKLLGAGYNSKTLFDDVLLVWHRSRNIIQSLKYLLPESFKTYPTINTYPEDVEHCFNHALHICPKCMKEHYHSAVHNLKHLKRCPFHPDTPIKRANVPYDLMKGMTYDLESSKKDNVRNYILPVDRRLPDTFYTDAIDGSLRRRIYPLNFHDRPGRKSYRFLPSLFSHERKPGLMRCLGKYRRDDFNEYFEDSYLTKPSVMEWLVNEYTFSNRIINYKKYGRASDHLTLLMYYKSFELLEDYLGRADSFFEICKSFGTGIQIPADDDMLIRLNFVWHISKYALFSHFFIETLERESAMKVLKANADILANIENAFLHTDDADALFAACTVYADVFDLLFEQFIDLEKREGSLHSLEGFQKLKTPEYYYIQTTDSQEDNILYRFD